MKWHHPLIIKIYEALGALADGRIEMVAEMKNTVKVYSSSGNKFYTVSYDPEKQAIMANDNGSFWKGYLGYPAIAYLLKTGVISYDTEMTSLLKDIKWKDINQKFKNDFDKTLAFILSSKTELERKQLGDAVSKIDGEIKKLKLSHLGKKTEPPEGY